MYVNDHYQSLFQKSFQLQINQGLPNLQFRTPKDYLIPFNG